MKHHKASKKCKKESKKFKNFFVIGEIWTHDISEKSNYLQECPWENDIIDIGLFSHIKINKLNYTIIKHFCDSKMLKDCIVIQNTHAWKISARLEQ